MALFSTGLFYRYGKLFKSHLFLLIFVISFKNFDDVLLHSLQVKPTKHKST